MKAKSKALLAVFAVALMLGCALVPVFSDNTKDVEADYANADEMEEFSISEILGSLLNVELDVSKGMDYFFMPVKTPEGEIKTFDIRIIVGPQSVESGIVTLSGEYNFKTDANGDNGCLVIKKGATLALFANESKSFSLVNHNSSAEENKVISLESGAKISVFGMTFELMGSDFALITMSSNGDSEGEGEDAKCTLTFDRDASGHSEFRVNASHGLKMTFADLVPFHNELPGSRDVIIVSGNFMPTLTSIGFTFSGSIVITEINNGKCEFLSNPNNFKFEVSNLSFSYDPNSTGADVKFSVSASINQDVALLNNRYRLTGVSSIDIKDITVSITRSNEDKSLILTLDSPGSVNVCLGESSLVVLQTKDYKVGLNPKGLSIGFDVSDYSSEYGLGNDGWTLKKMVMDGNLSFTYAEMNVQMNYKSFSLNLMSTGNLNIDSIRFDYSSSKQYSVTIGQITSSGVTSSMELSYTDTNYVRKLGLNSIVLFTELQYGIESNTNVTNIKVSNSGTGITFGFDELKSDFATVCRSADWNGEVVISGFSVTSTTGSDESNKAALKDIKIDRAYVRNDLPMQQVFSGLQYNTAPYYINLGLGPEDICIPTIGMELTDVVYDASKKQFDAGYIRIDVKHHRDIEEFSIEFSENVIVTVEPFDKETKHFSIVFNALGISGFVNNTGGERKDFNITSPSEVAFKFYFETNEPEKIPPIPSIYELLKFNTSLEIRNGNAKFDGGVLPFGIETGKSTTFQADGLTATGFVFDKDCTVSGTVALDTDVNLSPFYNEKSRTIKIGGDYELTPATNGYVITLDLSKKTEGTLVANQGSKLPGSFEEGGFSMTSGDHMTGTFTVGLKKTTVKLKCDREEYNLTYEGISEKKSIKYGNLVTLSTNYPQKSGLDFYGWNDGTRIYKPFDNFIMPSHDVVLQPVFIKVTNGTKVLEGSKTVLVAQEPEADLVRVNVTDLEWDVMRVTVGNTTFELDELVFEANCYKRLPEGQGVPTHIRPIVFQSTAVESNGDKTCFDLRVYMVEKDATFSEIALSFPIVNYKNVTELIVNTVFGTTVNMKVDGNVKGFNVYEIDYKGDYVPIDGVAFIQRGDGTYDVSFSINHVAQYVVEPIYEDVQFGGNNVMTAVIGVAIILICAIGIGFIWARRS